MITVLQLSHNSFYCVECHSELQYDNPLRPSVLDLRYSIAYCNFQSCSRYKRMLKIPRVKTLEVEEA